MKNLENLIKKTQLQFQLNALLRGMSIGIGIVFLYLTVFQEPMTAILTAVLATLLSAIFFGTLKPDREKAKNILHLHYPELEYSLSILDKEDKNIADLLQLKRLESSFRSKKAPLLIGQKVLPAILFLLAT